jgi:hypothetical protein
MGAAFVVLNPRGLNMNRVPRSGQSLVNGVRGQVEKYLNHEGHFLNMRCQTQSTDVVKLNSSPALHNFHPRLPV